MKGINRISEENISKLIDSVKYGNSNFEISIPVFLSENETHMVCIRNCQPSNVERQDFHIDKNIPYQEAVINQKRAKKVSMSHIFDSMDVGDSFKVPDEQRKRIISAAHRYGERKNKRFSIKLYRNSSGVEYRCWRLK